MSSIRPKHYTKYGEALITVLREMNFLQGNVIKYMVRYKDKNGVEDLRKAEWYLKELIEKEAYKEASQKGEE